MSHRFGRYDLTTLADGVFSTSSEVLIHPAGEAPRQAAIAEVGPKISIVVNCFALAGPDGITLIDAGTGPSWGEAMGHAPAAMKQAGIAPGAVKRILITHLHGDHALGLFDGEEPFFPRAEIIVPEADFAFFGDEAKRDAIPENKRGGFAITATLKRLYAGRIRTAAPGEVMPGLSLIPLPGHTFGHSGYLLEGGAQPLLFWGDALHLAGLQSADPDLGLVYDLDSALAIRSRRGILERAAGQGWLAAGSHVEGISRVERAGEGYRLVRVD